MAKSKITRHNHPLMVNARKESYYAGRRDGYHDGYLKGYADKCEEIHRYYGIVIAALETKIDAITYGLRKLRVDIDGLKIVTDVLDDEKKSILEKEKENERKEINR